MKHAFKVLVLVTLSSVMNLCHANSSTAVIHAKCYVELYGGEKVVSFFSLPGKQYKIDVATIQTLAISVDGVKQKQTIFKVLECVKEDRLFKDSKANRLERNMVW